ncbi:XTP/dITP diphosphatase [Candidatus Endomicrobiellum trichonymphae]|uniref:dITP/XTP pyrophosphatase n=1 Tax=Endomicrobium trichonymphae TaxID=1408204 RepID=B1H0K5_ENDTX|nr:XTP/dITP diphosphatase [Candidatus Endomicrobium trichonymphae]BAG14037.1 XTP/dITP diphosphohydrolase [Candidatus Endomicrobium trichonymphae]
MIKEIVLATENRHKEEEIKSILKDLDIEIVPMTSFPDYPTMIEEGATLEENASNKARKVAEFFKKWTIADDSGLEVDYLNGRPGIYSARYAGENCSYDDNNKKLLAELRDVPEEKRTANFRTVVAVASPAGRLFLADGKIFGTIKKHTAGTAGFGYDPVFYVPEYEKTFAELGCEIKNSLSHRAKALQKVKKIIKSLSNSQLSF